MLEAELKSLLQHLVDGSTRLSISKLYFLSNLTGEETRRLRNLWPDLPTQRRRQIVGNLVEIAEDSIEVNFDRIFRFCLQDSDEQVRAQAIEGLWENNDVGLIGPLVHILKQDRFPLVRAAAAATLGRFVLLGELGQIESAPAMLVEQALLQTINSPEEEIDVRRRAIESIAYSSEAGVRDIIEAAYYDEDDKMRCSAVFAMGHSADLFWRDLVITEIDSPDPEMRFEAARASGDLELRAALPHLARLLESESDREVLETAIWALGRIGGNEARRLLETCYYSDDEILGEAARAALEEMEMDDGDLVGFSFYEGEEGEGELDWDDEEEDDYDLDDEEG